MTSVLSNYSGNLALARVLLFGNRWLAAFTSPPSVLGILATEVAGGGYERQPIRFSTPSGKACVSTNKQTFPGMPACLVTHLGVWDHLAAGNLIFILELVDGDGAPAPITVAESFALVVNAGDIGLSL